jgi:hypothetical protein
MKELCIEGLATHDNPESCGCRREAGIRSVDRGCGRQGIELRNQHFGMPRPSRRLEGNTISRVMRVAGRSHAVEDPSHVTEVSMRENREISRTAFVPVCTVGHARQRNTTEPASSGEVGHTHSTDDPVEQSKMLRTRWREGM